jgi:hypothetical protein
MPNCALCFCARSVMGESGRSTDIQMVSALLVRMLQSCPVLPKGAMSTADSETVRRATCGIGHLRLLWVVFIRFLPSFS